jgi:hypothetical protein
MPKGAVSPFPLQASQTADRAEVQHTLADRTTANLKAEPRDGISDTRLIVGIAAGATVIAAALIYFSKGR